MAEYFVGPVMEKLIDACFEYLKDQVRWQTGMMEELQSLRKIHPQIKAVVSAYSKAQIDDPELNKWYWQLRDAIDEADDVFDEFEYWKCDKQVSNKRKISKVRSLMKSLKKRFVKIGKRALKIDPYLKRLEEAVHNLCEVSNRVSTFLRLLDSANQEQQKQQFELHKTRETGSMPTNHLLGRREEMEFVREWLRNSGKTQVTATTDLYRNISLLSVVGHGGMGKTTLLQHVYHDIDITSSTKEFDVKIWVCVSTNFDSKTVIANILKSLKKQASNEDPLETLQTSLQSEVMSKKFLLVLDDIWEEDEVKWENVIAPLRYGSSGSMILITTRLDLVVSTFEKMIKNNKTFQIEGLEEDKSLELFTTHAFAGVENPDDELKSIAGKIVKKLFGCPLAAKVIGGILNLNIDNSYWIKVLNTNIGKVTNLGNVRPGQNYFLSILKLSYIFLPDYLQNCFTFCSIFRQDYQFDKNDLVRMWVALGFIQSSNIQGETLEDTGRRYFNILVRKSFFDKSRTYDDRTCYKMHDLLRELAQSVNTQEYFRVDENSTIPPETIRHLSIYTEDISLETILQKVEKLKQLRSLFMFSIHVNGNTISKILKASKNIRLLVIYTLFGTKMPETFSCFIHLRYLKYNCGFGFLKLPRSISHLYHLLFIVSKSLMVSKELMLNENCQLIMDALLINDPSVLLMEPLRSICSFPALEIEENDELVSFPTETEQWFLQHTSSLTALKFESLQSLESLPSSLESLSSLERLDLRLLGSLQCLPSSLSTISSLTHLTVNYISLLKSLPDLPSSLEYLWLEELESLQCLPSCLPTPLNTLRIDNVPRLLELPDLPAALTDLRIMKVPLLLELPDLPSSLEDLWLEELESLQCLPSCLPTLYKLWINKVPLLLELPDLPSSLKKLQLSELESLQCLPSCLPTTLYELRIIKVPLLLELPDLPSSLKELQLSELESLQCLPSCLPTTLNTLMINSVPRVLELPDLPSSLKELELRKLESLQWQPSCLPTTLNTLMINSVPRVLELPDLPSSLEILELRKLESLQWQPSCLPTTLHTLYIINVPRLLELPDLPASLQDLYIEDCDPQLMERYKNRSRISDWIRYLQGMI